MIKYGTETHKSEQTKDNLLRNRYAGIGCVNNREERMHKYISGLEVHKIKKKLGSCNGCESLIDTSDGSLYCTFEDIIRWTDEVKDMLKYFFS